MEENTLPSVLKRIINSINAEGELQSWQINTTLQTYSLTLIWTRPFNTCDDKQSDSRPENLTQKPDQTAAPLNEDRDKNGIEEADVRENEKTHQERCAGLSPRTDDRIEEDTDFNAYSEAEVAEAVMNENEVKYETQISSIQGRRKSGPLNENQLCRRNYNSKTQFHLHQEKIMSITPLVSQVK